MRIVLALGGRSLTPPGVEVTPGAQRSALRACSAALVEVAADHELVVACGPGVPGRLVEQQVAALLPPGRDAVTLVARDPVDDTVDDTVDVVPVGAVSALLDLGHVVVCDGVGSECPGMTTDDVDAVLAEQLGADLLVLSTDVEGVHEGWETDTPHVLHLVDLVDLSPASLEAGSIRPKVEAAAHFARSGGRSVIGPLADLRAMVAGAAGTTVVDTSWSGGRDARQSWAAPWLARM